MIPQKIQPYFETTRQKNDGKNSLVEGILTCCHSHEFEVLVVGEVKRGMFSKMYLLSKDNRIVLEARCKKCGKVMSVFDSSCDGYEQCGKNQPAHAFTQRLACKKCRDSGFSVGVKYEYPAIQELEELQKTEIDNAFTWIWSTLTCNKCGVRYKNFIDYETA